MFTISHLTYSDLKPCVYVILIPPSKYLRLMGNVFKEPVHPNYRNTHLALCIQVCAAMLSQIVVIFFYFLFFSFFALQLQ